MRRLFDAEDFVGIVWLALDGDEQRLGEGALVRTVIRRRLLDQERALLGRGTGARTRRGIALRQMVEQGGDEHLVETGRDERRHALAWQPASAPAPTPTTLGEADALLSKLTPNERQITVRRESGEAMRQIAADLGLAESSCWGLHRRALRRLEAFRVAARKRRAARDLRP